MVNVQAEIYISGLHLASHHSPTVLTITTFPEFNTTSMKVLFKAFQAFISYLTDICDALLTVEKSHSPAASALLQALQQKDIHPCVSAAASTFI